MIRLLGPLAVEVDGEPVRLGSVKQKAILAQLALHGGQIAQLAELVAGLWGEDPPATATNTIQVHVSALRRALGRAGSLIETRPPGYRLEGADVDVLRFEQLIDEARQGRPTNGVMPRAVDGRGCAGRPGRRARSPRPWPRDWTSCG